MPPEQAQVVVISASVGAGHTGAAEELVRRLVRRGVSTTHYDYLDALPRALRWVLCRGYTFSVGYAPWFFQWLFRGVDGSGWVHWMALLVCRLAHRRVLRWCMGGAVVVSTYMLASQTLGQLKVLGRLRCPVVTFVPDPAVHRLWIHAGVEHHWAVTTTGAREASDRFGIPVRPVAALVDARFGAPVPEWRRDTLRNALDIPGGELTVLLAAGSLGLG
ncbi:MAG: MGDG synthase family glycosyltransferase, partial [Sciscionella sp.]